MNGIGGGTTPVHDGPGGASLRSWLEQHGEAVGVLRVRDAVDPAAYEATAILAQLETGEGAPPVLFERVSDLRGEVAEFPMLFNVYASLASIRSVLSLPNAEWPDLLEALPARSRTLRPPRRVEEAPVRERVWRGGEVDLRMLPWTRHVEMEGGPYLTPIVVSRGPGTDRYNLSWNRVMYLDATHAGVHISPRQLWAFERQAEEAGEDLPVALVLGHHPAFNLAAAALTGMDIDEYDVAGGLLGEPLDVVPSIAHGDDLVVPAAAEILVEGRLVAARRVVEGPFGEYMRYLGPQKLSHLFEVDAITWREGGIVLEVFAGHSDHLNAHVSIHASLLALAQASVPQVLRLGWFRGGGPTTAVVAVRKSAEGQPMRAAMAVMAAGNLIKQVIVVDEDIDVFDAQQVMWAVSTRVQADRDVQIVRGLQGSLLDPSHPGFGTTSGIVVDATWPLDRPRAPVARVPEWAVARFPIDRYRIEEG